MPSRTITLSHRGTTAVVREGHDDRCVIEINNQVRETDKKFGPAAREALTYLLKHAGEMKGHYER